MSRSYIETTVHVFMAFLETCNHLSFCLSLQPFQSGLTRTQRKSANIPTRVSIQPAALSVWIYVVASYISKVFLLCLSKKEQCYRVKKS